MSRRKLDTEIEFVEGVGQKQLQKNTSIYKSSQIYPKIHSKTATEKKAFVHKLVEKHSETQKKLAGFADCELEGAKIIQSLTGEILGNFC